MSVLPGRWLSPDRMPPLLTSRLDSDSGHTSSDMKRRFVQINGELIEVTKDYVQEPVAPAIFGDIEPYESPASGKMIEGRAQRREDFKATNTRPFEGIEQERKEAARRRAYEEARHEKKLDESVGRAFYSLSPEKRRQLLYGN